MSSTNGGNAAPMPAWALRAAEPSSTPSWATTANQPLVPTIDLSGVKKQVKQEMKEIQKAVDALAKLTRKRGSDSSAQVISLSDQVRRRARLTTATIRDAMTNASEGTAEYTALSKMGEELKAVLREFQKHVEAASAASEASSSSSCGAAGSSNDVGCTALVAPAHPHSVTLQIEGGVQPAQQQQQVMMQQELATQEQMAVVACNNSMIADREAGIDGIAKSVQELHEIFEDINALVLEQGDHIDNIQTNIEKASSHQARAVTELVAASRHQRRSRKMMCWVIILLVLLMIILLVVLKFGSHSIG